MKSAKHVSIIVPVYNVEKFIEKCARSLFEQTYLDIEYIFVDDCSFDKSINILEAILEEYPNRKEQTRIIRHEENKGLPSARNSGLKLATGEYIFHCDSDDYLDINAIKLLLEDAEKNNADIVWCDFYKTYQNKEIISKQNISEDKEECIKSLMTEKMHGGVWNKMYKKNLFTDYTINFPDGYSMWEDLCTNIKLFHFAKKVSYLPKSFYHYRQNNDNSMSLNLNEKKFNEILYNTDDIVNFFKEKQINKYDEEINILKLASKQTLLFTLKKSNFKKWRAIYPESNEYILKFTSLPLHLRLLGFIITKKLWILADLWIFLKKIKNFK